MRTFKICFVKICISKSSPVTSCLTFMFSNCPKRLSFRSLLLRLLAFSAAPTWPYHTPSNTASHGPYVFVFASQFVFSFVIVFVFTFCFRCSNVNKYLFFDIWLSLCVLCVSLFAFLWRIGIWFSSDVFPYDPHLRGSNIEYLAFLAFYQYHNGITSNRAYANSML